MPRRRKPLPSEISRDEISLLLADARMTMKGEPDPRKRRKLERDRDLAIGQLTQMYRRAEKRGQKDQLDFRVRLFCELLKDRSKAKERQRLRAAFPEKSADEIECILGEGSLPKPKGGRPAKEHDRFSIAADVLEAIERHGVEERGSVEEALEEVAERHATTYRYVRNIYYEFYDCDPNWRRAVLLDLAMRDADPERRYTDLKRWAWQRKKRDKG
jgi:hypothetical protein